MMRKIFYIPILLVIFSCSTKEKKVPFSIDYKLELIGGDEHHFTLRIPNLFQITCDSNYYGVPIYPDVKLVPPENIWYNLETKDTLSKLILNFHKNSNDSLVYSDTIQIKTINLPDPHLQFLPCDSSCNSVQSIKNIKNIYPVLNFFGIDIRAKVKQCDVSIIRSGNVVDIIKYDILKIDEEFKKLTSKLKVDDILMFSNINDIVMPDGSHINIKNEEILILNN